MVGHGVMVSHPGYGGVMGNHPAPTELKQRLARAASAARTKGFDALLVTPGPDLRYLTGYEALPLERLTCLIVRADGEAHLVVPRLEHPAAQASPAGKLDIPIHTWDETDDPFAQVADLLPGAEVVGLDNHMWAEKVLRLRTAMPASEQRLAGEVIGALRMRKTPAEIESLRAAGQAIDVVHSNMGQWLRAGRTERDVARDITAAIVEAGHAKMDFVIVASGPNGASPHHDVSDRVINPGEPIVVDIGGTMPDGYCSDSTRMYCVGEAPAAFVEYYGVLHAAQIAATEHVRPGVSCASVDEAARAVLRDAGWDKWFIHRTGHGIGLETHEDPYIVHGNSTLLEAGMAFSIEPGVYLPGQHGARIEDIVVCGESGADILNLRPRELVNL
jgi:Xaa-Pro aminopeptidase